MIPNEDTEGLGEGEDSYHFYELGVFCEATHYFKTCTSISFDMLTRVNGESLINSKTVFNSNKMQLEIGGYNITEDFQHEILQADNAFKLVRQTDRSAVYKYANREIGFTYAHGDKNKLALVMISLGKELI